MMPIILQRFLERCWVNGVDEKYILLTTKGHWFSSIVIGQKQFDFRKGYRDIKVGDIVRFVKSDEHGNQTGLSCDARVNFVVHSRDFPAHFGWDGEEFTIIQFNIVVRHKMDEGE